MKFRSTFRLTILSTFLFINTISFASQFKALLVSGDSTVENFDRSRTLFGEILERKFRIPIRNQTHLSVSEDLISKKIKRASADQINKSLEIMFPGQKKGCLLFLTGHGDINNGFPIQGSGDLAPHRLGNILDKHCRNRPSVVIISACYSGQFIDHNLRRPNRVILTSAISNRPSFGCDSSSVIPYWDQCFFESIEIALLSITRWQDLYNMTNRCVEKREKDEGVNRSFPQFFAGPLMKNKFIR